MRVVWSYLEVNDPSDLEDFTFDGLPHPRSRFEFQVNGLRHEHSNAMTSWLPVCTSWFQFTLADFFPPIFDFFFSTGRVVCMCGQMQDTDILY